MPWRFAGSRAVYPRWRGEHRSSHYFPFFFDGLSPLARGTRRQRIVRLPLHRFIPAGAGNTSTLSITTDREPVYPRWRGEHPNGSALSYPQIGLSPLARGTQSDAIDALIDARFIPAGAGNTKFILINTAFVSVYPRWRGEHFTTIGGHATAHGLSPLARGTQIWGAPLMKSKRFIPAGAGNTAADSRAGHHRPVYPRWRGEHGPNTRPSIHAVGLSPLARGTQLRRSTQLNKPRFIPAGAGNTC